MPLTLKRSAWPESSPIPPDIIPIPGSSSPAHLAENAAAVDLRLSSDDLAELEVAFPPHAVAGARMEQFLLERVGL